MRLFVTKNTWPWSPLVGRNRKTPVPVNVLPGAGSNVISAVLQECFVSGLSSHGNGSKEQSY